MNVQDLSMSHHELRGLAIEHILDSQFNASRRAQEEKKLEKKKSSLWQDCGENR